VNDGEINDLTPEQAAVVDEFAEMQTKTLGLIRGNREMFSQYHNLMKEIEHLHHKMLAIADGNSGFAQGISDEIHASRKRTGINGF
jgi:hypothetical protein